MGVVSQTATTVARKSVACHKLRLKLFGKKPVIGASKFSKKVPMLSCLEKSTLAGEQRTSYAGNDKLNLILGTKRKPERALDCQERKRLKMNRGATLNCEVVLEKLMKHRHGYPFIQPEYFDIIENIMDLGTIKGKLDQNMYCGAEEFESDVRLTFSHALLYNPTNNAIRQYAKELSTIFDNFWKPVKAKMNRQVENTRQRTSESSLGKIAHDMNKKCLKSLSSHVDKLPEKTMFPREEKSEDGKAKDYKSSKTHRPAPDSIGLVSCRCEDRAYPMSAYPDRSRERRVQSIMNMNRGNAKEVRSVKNVPRNQCQAVEVKNTPTSQVSRSDSDSNAPVSSLDEEHARTSSPVTTGSIDGTATTKGLETILDIQLSPSKALRAAMLKCRFAETILKAQHNTLLEPGGRAHPVILQQEKEILERRQLEEKARIELELKKQWRQQEREAARIILEKMKRSIDLDDNIHVRRDLEALIGRSLCLSRRESRLRSPLEKLGLFIKDEYMVGDVDESFLQEGDLEDGQVF